MELATKCPQQLARPNDFELADVERVAAAIDPLLAVGFTLPLRFAATASSRKNSGERRAWSSSETDVGVEYTL